MSKEIKKSFFENQFSEEITSSQNWFDAIFGIIIPILCLIFDPLVFRDNILGGQGYLSSIRLFAYLSIGAGITTFSMWLLLKARSPLLVGVISGILLSGALVATALGLAILPFSFLGLIVLVGVLGFTPFLTAFAYLRNGIRAIRKIHSASNRILLIMTIVTGFILVIGIPFELQVKATELVSKSIHTIIYGDEHEIISAVENLKNVFWCSKSCYDEIVWAYNEEKNEEKRQHISNAYFRITGTQIDDQLDWLLRVAD